MKSIIQKGERTCFVCGSTTVECHHIFGGPNRQLSEKYGLKVYLCPEHHRRIHEGGRMMDALHEEGERAYIRQYNADCEDFRRVFGKNYL